eukprot:NODE_1_length_95616_cov_0.657642.p8 type:complete len:545 gc:universal NODE_1_length_95616_cov_0.657642:93183-91549(-)
MLDLLIGRPSRSYKRIQFILPAVYVYYKTVKPFFQKNSSNGLSNFLIAIFLIYRCIRNLPLILGIDPPENRVGYARDYYRATWITQAMDAGFWSCAKIPVKWVRDMASVVATGYYLIAYETATAKCAKFRAQPTVNMLKISWEKQKNMIFAAAIRLSLPTIGYKEVKNVLRDPEEWGYNPKDIATTRTITHIYFNGSKSDFMDHKDIIFFIPGGGWLATDPTSHIQMIYDLVKFTNVPVIALDYLKSPKYPFPYALEECIGFYKQFVSTNGTFIGMNSINKHRRVILLGDSAGGNMASGLIIKLILQEYKLPHHCIMMYPCLNLDLKCWLEPGQMELLNTKELTKVNSFLDTNTGEHRRVKSLLAMEQSTQVEHAPIRGNKSFFDLTKKVIDYQNRDLYKDPTVWSEFGNRNDIEDERILMRSYDVDINHNSPATFDYLQNKDGGHIALTSRICFFQDKILPAELMRALVLLYLKNSPMDPQINTNFVLSPLLAPDVVLAKFPKVSILVGDRDPLLDDSILMCAKLRRAQKDHNAAQLTVIPGW